MASKFLAAKNAEINANRPVRVRTTSIYQWLLGAFLAVLASSAFAGIKSDGLLDDVTQKFFEQSSTWGFAISTYATWLFWTLATISMVWTFGMMALRKADLGEFFAEFLRFTITTGFFFWLLTNGPKMAISIINSMRTIGAVAGNVSQILTPSTPLMIGFDIVKKAFDSVSWVHPVDSLGMVLVTLAMLLCMAIVAANILIAMVTAWIMAYAGVFILGFGGARWTSEMAIGYFKAMLSIGLELMTITLMVGIAISTIDGFYTQVDGSSLYDLMLVFCVTAVLALLIDKIPPRVAALAGAPIGAGAGHGIGAGTVLAAAAVAGAAAASAGAGLMGGVRSAGGGFDAILEAYKSAGESGGGGDSGTEDSYGGGSSDGGKGSDGGLASAMGEPGGAGSGAKSSAGSGSAEDGAPAGGGGTESAGTGEQSAASGAQQTGSSSGGGSRAGRTAAILADAIDSQIKKDYKASIGKTTGGKIAESIREAREKQAKQSAQDGFAGNSLAAGTGSKLPDTSDPDGEIAAFRDKT